MEPREDFTKQLVKMRMMIEKRVSELTEDNKKAIYEQNLELAKLQSEDQNTEVLPTLTIDDIPKRVIFMPLIWAK